MKMAVTYLSELKLGGTVILPQGKTHLNKIEEAQTRIDCKLHLKLEVLITFEEKAYDECFWQ